MAVQLPPTPTVGLHHYRIAARQGSAMQEAAHPRWAPPRASTTSTRGIKPKDLSTTSSTCSGSIGWKKDGQPVPQAGIFSWPGCSFRFSCAITHIYEANPLSTSISRSRNYTRSNAAKFSRRSDPIAFCKVSRGKSDSQSARLRHWVSAAQGRYAEHTCAGLELGRGVEQGQAADG